MKQTRYEWVHLFAAVGPRTGASSALVSPGMNAGFMNVFLKQLVREELRRTEHAIVIMDQASWHTSTDLEVPEDITILLLTPSSPELNPVNRVCAYLRSYRVGDRAFAEYDELPKAGTEACGDWRRSYSSRSARAIAHDRAA